MVVILSHYDYKLMFGDFPLTYAGYDPLGKTEEQHWCDFFEISCRFALNKPKGYKSSVHQLPESQKIVEMLDYIAQKDQLKGELSKAHQRCQSIIHRLGLLLPLDPVDFSVEAEEDEFGFECQDSKVECLIQTMWADIPLCLERQMEKLRQGMLEIDFPRMTSLPRLTHFLLYDEYLQNRLKLALWRAHDLGLLFSLAPVAVLKLLVQHDYIKRKILGIVDAAAALREVIETIQDYEKISVLFDLSLNPELAQVLWGLTESWDELYFGAFLVHLRQAGLVEDHLKSLVLSDSTSCSSIDSGCSSSFVLWRLMFKSKGDQASLPAAALASAAESGAHEVVAADFELV